MREGRGVRPASFISSWSGAKFPLVWVVQMMRGAVRRKAQAKCVQRGVRDGGKQDGGRHRGCMCAARAAVMEG